MCRECFEIKCMDTAPFTGRCITGDSAVSVIVQITDACPECAADHIDIQALTFNKLAPMNTGRINIHVQVRKVVGVRGSAGFCAAASCCTMHFSGRLRDKRLKHHHCYASRTVWAECFGRQHTPSHGARMKPCSKDRHEQVHSLCKACEESFDG